MPDISCLLTTDLCFFRDNLHTGTGPMFGPLKPSLLQEEQALVPQQAISNIPTLTTSTSLTELGPTEQCLVLRSTNLVMV